jgi:hypothetical protein
MTVRRPRSPTPWSVWHVSHRSERSSPFRAPRAQARGTFLGLLTALEAKPFPAHPVACLRAGLHPSLANWVHAVRNDTGEKRSAALADIYELLRQWEAGTDPEDVSAELAARHSCTAQVYAAAMERLHRYVRGAVMDEAIWLLRWGVGGGKGDLEGLENGRGVVRGTLW